MSTSEDAAWTMPDVETVYHVEGGRDITLRQMLEGLDPELIPTDQAMFEDLLWAYGAWDDCAKMHEAVATRVYGKGPDGRIGFRSV